MKHLTIKSHIDNIPAGMKLVRGRSHYLLTPRGVPAKVFKSFKKKIDRFKVLRLISLVRHFQFRFNDGHNAFTNIPVDVLRSTAGNGYKKYLEYLSDYDVLELNDIYRKGEFSKSYRFTPASFRKGFTVTKWIVDALLDKPSDDGIPFTPNGIYDAQLIYCLEFELRLVVPEPDTISETFDTPEDISYSSEWFYRINNGSSFLPNKQEKSSRFYFNSIMMPSKYRKYLRYGDKLEELVNFDICSAYPSFIKTLCIAASGDSNRSSSNNGLNNNKVYKETSVSYLLIGKNIQMGDFYSADFYQKLVDGVTYKNRDSVKVAFNSYRNLDCKEKRMRHPLTKRLIEIGEVDMANWIANTDRSHQILEDYESALLAAICDRCIDLDIIFIRHHDGFLTTMEHKESMSKLLSEEFSMFKFKSNTLTEME